MREPLLAPLAALACGIALAGVTEFQPGELLLPIGVLSLLALLALARRLRRALLLSIHVIVLFSGALLAVLHRPGSPPVIDATPWETVVIEGCVVETPTYSDGREHFVVEFDHGARANVNVYDNIGVETRTLRYGQRLDITGRLRTPHNFQNPGGFDYERYLARQDIYWTLSVSDPSDVQILPGSCGSRFWSAILRLRAAGLNRLQSLYHDTPIELAMLRAILLGETSQVGTDSKESFRRTGTYHTLVISGLHLTVLAAFLHLILRVLGLPFGWRATLTLLAVWVYAFTTGCHTPVLRAAAGLSLYFAAGWFFRCRRLLNILAAIAIVFLVVDPEQLFEASFHLSFLAVAMIGAFAIPLVEGTTAPFTRSMQGLGEADRDLHLPPKVAQLRLESRLIAETLSLWSHLPQSLLLGTISLGLRVAFHLAELAVVSAVIQVGLSLPMATYFHRISFTGFVANPIIVPLMSLAVPAGAVAIATGWVVAVKIAGLLVWASQSVVLQISGWDAGLRLPPPPLWLGAAFLLSLIGAAWLLRHGGRYRWATPLVPLLLLTAVLVHPFPPRIVAGSLEMTAVDVGQAESLFIALPDAKTLVVDGGGIPARGDRVKATLDIGEDVVSPYLWSRSIRRLDAIASSHGHADHIEGLFALLENFHPRQLWLSSVAKDPASMALAARAAAVGAEVIYLNAGQQFSFGGAAIEVLAPFDEHPAANMAKNEDSLVLRITHGSHSFLLTGDIDQRVEERIAAGLQPTTVLKAAHHGSQTSSTQVLLDAAKPIMAVVSAGYQNSYRFPHPAVLERIARQRTTLIRTDMHGLVTLSTDGEHLTFRARQWDGGAQSSPVHLD